MKKTFASGSLWLTLPITILTAAAAGCGVFMDGLYRDGPALVSQAKAQDLVTLVVALPVLVSAAVLARSGSLRAHLAWLGCMVYLVYTYAGYAFAVKYNPLFLVYIALLGCSLFALIGGLAELDMAEIKARYAGQKPARAASLFLAGLMALFYAVWLSELVPALIAGTIPQSILDSGTPTNMIHVLDMAWILPSFGIAALSLWRKEPLGYATVGVLLVFLVLLVLATLWMGLVQVLEGSTEAIPMTVLFGTIFFIALGMQTWYLKNLGLASAMGKISAI